MSEAVRTTLAGYLSEAMDLRFGATMPDTHDAPNVVLDALLDVRQRLDRVEELLGRAIRLKATTHRASALASANADDAWDRAIQRARTAPVGRDEYSSAKERHADANLTVLDERRAARSAAELAHVCDEAVDVLRLSHRGLDGVRHDLLTILRTLQFESTLER